MNQGLYEQLITQLISDQLTAEADTIHAIKEPLAEVDSAHYLAQHLARIIKNSLNALPTNNKLENQLAITNALLSELKKNEHANHDLIDESAITNSGELLKAVYRTVDPIAADLDTYANNVRPITGLSQSELFTGSNAGLSLEAEIKREIASSDEIWWLVSFVKWSGVRVFEKVLKAAARRGAKIRLVTTSYMGATDQKAVDFFASLPNCEVRLNYNTDRERLHAKAYLFIRNTGFDTGYIGSSNLSRSALTNGLEWNLKTTTQEVPHIIDKFKKTFESYWSSDEFIQYQGNEDDRERLNTELQRARGNDSDIIHSIYFDLTPHPYQQEILEQLRVERDFHHRHRNLVVAATGTGKTIISAFDFRDFMKNKPDAKFLFIAHREEILKQARATFRAVLKDNAFGQLWVGGSQPSHYQQLFASIQTLNNHLAALNLSPNYYDYIVFDEVHHIPANSYRDTLDYFESQILLGLTATPERADGKSILGDFCDTIAAELRLPEAINNRHLCPFQYFGVDDPVDLSGVTWQRGKYDVSELTNLYTQNDLRAKHIIENTSHIVGDLSEMKALAFCVSIEHAEHMAKYFDRHGIPAKALTSNNAGERGPLQTSLRNGLLKVLCVVDIFNEGVDIPEINTVLFLRPTESLTVFLQQLGRGLRLADNKDCLTVLDFVGNANVEYDFAQKFRALVGRSERPIKKEVEHGFPHLPIGCSIVLQEQTQETILRNIQEAIPNRNRIIQALRRFSQQTNMPLTIKNFLSFNPNISLSDLYKGAVNGTKGWSRLRIAANTLPGQQLDDLDLEKAYQKAIFNRIITSECPEYLMFIKDFLAQETLVKSEINDQRALMMYYDFFNNELAKTSFNTVGEAFNYLRANTLLVDECTEVAELCLNDIKHETFPLDVTYPTAIRVHGRYSRDQILCAFGAHQFERRSNSREGVLALQALHTELLFVTLNKDQDHYSPTTMYHDYAISETLFHWQSQNSARPDKGKGLSYITHEQDGKKIILFAREQTKDALGRTMGFVCLGTVKYVTSNGSQPMNVTWKLDTPLPPSMWHEAAKLAVG